MLLPAIISRLRQTAPGIDIRVSRLDRHNIYRQLDRGEVDIALGGHLSGTESHYVRTLFEEHLVCIASRSHPQLADDRWDLARYLSLPHGLYAPADDGSARGLVDRRLAEIGGRRRVAVTFSHIVALPAVVADSDLIATLAASVARRFSDPQRVRFLPLPDELAIAPFPIELIAGRQAQHDPALIWLCELIGQIPSISARLNAGNRCIFNRSNPHLRPRRWAFFAHQIGIIRIHIQQIYIFDHL